jgi:hypothetical protein
VDNVARHISPNKVIEIISVNLQDENWALGENDRKNEFSASQLRGVRNTRYMS